MSIINEFNPYPADGSLNDASSYQGMPMENGRQQTRGSHLLNEIDQFQSH